MQMNVSFDEIQALKDQGRFGTNPYDDLQLYMDQAAVFHARTMNTLRILLQGTEDGSVD
jgi:hypothetical protein